MTRVPVCLWFVFFVWREREEREQLLKGMLGLYVTWPTSYEALVGRAELKPGALALFGLCMCMA